MKITKSSEMVKKCLNYFFWPKTREYPHAMFMKKICPKKYQKFLKTSEKNLKFFWPCYLIVFDWERPEYTHKHYLQKNQKSKRKKCSFFYIF